MKFNSQYLLQWMMIQYGIEHGFKKHNFYGIPAVDGLVRDEQKVFEAMDADETGRYLPFGYRNGVPSPRQKDKRADIAKLNRIQLHLDALVTQMGQQLYDGQIAAEPLVAGAGRTPCVWCDYSFICCHETGIGERALEAPAKPFEPEEPCLLYTSRSGALQTACPAPAAARRRPQHPDIRLHHPRQRSE